MSSGPGSKRCPRRKPKPSSMISSTPSPKMLPSISVRDCSKLADQVGALHSTEALNLEGPGEFDHRLRLHQAEFGNREPGDVRIESGCRGFEWLVFVRADFAWSVIRALTTFAAISAFDSAATAAAAIITIPPTTVIAIVAAAVAAIVSIAAELAIPAVAAVG